MRLIYFGLSKLHLSVREVELFLLGELLDLYECHLQEAGITTAAQEVFIDDIIPWGI